jgi:hypothetical protein
MRPRGSRQAGFTFLEVAIVAGFMGGALAVFSEVFSSAEGLT